MLDWYFPNVRGRDWWPIFRKRLSQQGVDEKKARIRFIALQMLA
jgi:hypothetical protein